MLTEYPLDISAELRYAARWAYYRNPAFYDFDALGGDCTNFISQCIYAGGAVMNYTPDTGWYYISPDDRAAAWTGVEYFARFITSNKGAGPFGSVIPVRYAAPGDVIQLGGAGRFYHSLLVIAVRGGIPYIAAHTRDANDVPLTAYRPERIRCLRIRSARRYSNGKI
ncbi:MAG: amidase domain-containing protein [Ruminococcus sp.]|nr:amidase domain-containing protein [Ruminococcus sp.]